MTRTYSEEVSAAAVETLTLASHYLSNTLGELRRAHRVISSEDIPHNKDTTQDLIGALHVVQKALINERIAWEGYNQARRKQ